ncbi:MAG: prephenate dehydrogenase/arogenate dehydrogenase family protein [Anaerolineales bacterium]|nr:prephenate dehydrogenase/arogenate dehydrogenase family protein [Anaerolineales bacterium]
MSDDLSDFKLHIIGLGLMGGSLALAVREHVRYISADDLNPATLQAALQQGVIDAIGGGEQSDIVIVAIPAHRIVDYLQTLTVRSGALVIDLGSTKGAICDALDHLPPDVLAVGGHPMCGLAENGFSNAIPTLYHGARFVLCETARTTAHARHLAEQVALACGAVPLWMNRHQHDYLTAMTSHLPHLLNFALMRLAVEVSEEDPRLFELAAGGFDGATRLARTNAAMITGMFMTNADNLRTLTARLRQQLDDLEALFDNPNQLNEELRKIVEARRYYTKSYGERSLK